MADYKVKKYFDSDNVIRVHLALERSRRFECTTGYGELDVHLGLGYR